MKPSPLFRSVFVVVDSEAQGSIAYGPKVRRAQRHPLKREHSSPSPYLLPGIPLTL